MATLRRNALGRGLDALLSMDDVKTEGSSSINEIELAKIAVNPNQPRREFDETALQELADSIAEIGIIQPITLRKVSDDEYQIFLAGDLNAEPESAFIKYLQQDFQILSDVNQHTFPAPAPTETIDYITALKQNMKGFTVTSAQVVNEPVASDHRPLVVVLEQK